MPRPAGLDAEMLCLANTYKKLVFEWINASGRRITV
jgi:hypothetical protein